PSPPSPPSLHDALPISGWLLAACLLTTVVYWIRAWRWGEILSPVARVPGGRLFATTMVGFLAINTLPARLGELVRAYALARSERDRKSTRLNSSHEWIS